MARANLRRSLAAAGRGRLRVSLFRVPRCSYSSICACRSSFLATWVSGRTFGYCNWRPTAQATRVLSCGEGTRGLPVGLLLPRWLHWRPSCCVGLSANGTPPCNKRISQLIDAPDLIPCLEAIGRCRVHCGALSATRDCQGLLRHQSSETPNGDRLPHRRCLSTLRPDRSNPTSSPNALYDDSISSAQLLAVTP